MSYFLKITEKKDDNYLQIYDSSRVKWRKNNVSKCIRSLGCLSKLATQEMPDPIAHYRDYCKEEDRKRKDAKRLRSAATVGDEELEFFDGNALVDAFLGSVGSGRLMKMRSRIYERGGKFDYAGILKDLISARLIAPASKLRTYEDVIPQLYRHGDYSLGGVYDAPDGLGEDYDGAIEMFNLGIRGLYEFRTDRTYFDCTNFYFEIDMEDEWRRKGPSKENRKDPILGLRLLLDANCVPVGMKIYPGNASEKPVQREMVRELRESNRIEGRTVIVADEGLNCARNIRAALSAKDGYIYSRSVASLPEREKRWVLSEEGSRDDAYVVKNGDDEVVFMRKSCADSFEYSFVEGGKRRESRDQVQGPREEGRLLQQGPKGQEAPGAPQNARKARRPHRLQGKEGGIRPVFPPRQDNLRLQGRHLGEPQRREVRGGRETGRLQHDRHLGGE